MPKGDINPQDDIDALINDPFASWAKRKKRSVSEKSELDRYFEEPKKPWIKDYDVLTYWKRCESQLPDMARMARDILTTPVSTVTSESSFSAGGGVIDKYRSSLLPKNAEDFDLIEEDEKLSEALGDVLVLEPIPSMVGFVHSTAVTNTHMASTFDHCS
ncbi:Zinc finger BED domain-containing protein [Drosera capensis]